jgi:ankyrin repeat protein
MNYWEKCTHEEYVFMNVRCYRIIQLFVAVISFYVLYTRSIDPEECPSELNAAAYNGDTRKLVQLSQKNRLDLLVCESTPLYMAASNPDAQVAHKTAVWLIANGAEPSIDTPDESSGMTPLGMACTRNNLPLVELLCSKGADLDLAFKEADMTSLVWSIQNNKVDLFKLLLAKKANINVVDQNTGQKAIHKATQMGCHDILNIILEKKLQKPTDQDFEGNTPLHLAATSTEEGMHGDMRIKIIKLLLAKGALKKTLNNDKKTAYDLGLKIARQRNPDLTDVQINAFEWLKLLKP